MSTDFADIQKRLNSDQTFRQKFLDDPVNTLSDEGVTLNEEMQKNLIKLVDDIKDPKPPVSGASTAPKGDPAADGVGIAISIEF